MVRTAGLFLTHVRSERIERHYSRLVRDTEGLVDWHFAFNRGSLPAVELDVPYQPPDRCMRDRHAEMLRHGGVIGGYGDTVLIPPILAIDADFTWVMEYDVDFSGHWSAFFRQFADNRADLLTTTIIPRPQCSDWYWWRNAVAPDEISSERMYRGFHPMMRLSRRFARLYRQALAGGQWSGHYEFLMPTMGAALGLRVEDIGGALASRPETWGPANYVNNPLDPLLRPGTFRWRPAQRLYFHEQPGRFPVPNKLYHPVKPRTARLNQPE